MFEITPITLTQTNWSHFVNACNTATGRSPTRELDRNGFDETCYGSYVLALGEFHKKGSDPNKIVQNNPGLLRHMSLGLLVSCNRELLHYILTTLHDYSIVMGDPGRNKENCIITASMYFWRQATIESCQDRSSVDGREFFNQIWVLLEKFGFRDIFAGYRRRELHDNTFVLDQRK